MEQPASEKRFHHDRFAPAPSEPKNDDAAHLIDRLNLAINQISRITRIPFDEKPATSHSCLNWILFLNNKTERVGHIDA